MSKIISWDTSKDNAPMIVSHSDGRVTVIPFDTAVKEAVPAISRKMGESLTSVIKHFSKGEELQVGNDTLKPGK